MFCILYNFSVIVLFCSVMSHSCIKAGSHCVMLTQWMQMLLKRIGRRDKIADLSGRVGSSVLSRYRKRNVTLALIRRHSIITVSSPQLSHATYTHTNTPLPICLTNHFFDRFSGTITSVLKIRKIRNIYFVGNLILNIHTTFLDDDVIIVTSSDNRTQSICELFSPSVYYRNSQVLTAYERHWCFIFTPRALRS